MREGLLAGRVRIGNLGIDCIGQEEILARFHRAVLERRPQHVVTVNLQFVGQALRQPAFAGVVNQADIVVADGMPLLWLSALRRVPIPARITGHDLLHGSANLAQAHGYSLFFLGSTPEVAQEACRQLAILYPGLRIAGAVQGNFGPDGRAASEAEDQAVVDAITRCRPDFLFVALGCPKQEFWIHRHLSQVQVPVCVGIGGVLDVVASRRRRAPRWVQRLGLEWMYRLQQEPHRLWRRYLLSDLPTACRLGAPALVRWVLVR